MTLPGMEPKCNPESQSSLVLKFVGRLVAVSGFSSSHTSLHHSVCLHVDNSVFSVCPIYIHVHAYIVYVNINKNIHSNRHVPVILLQLRDYMKWKILRTRGRG